MNTQYFTLLILAFSIILFCCKPETSTTIDDAQEVIANTPEKAIDSIKTVTLPIDTIKENKEALSTVNLEAKPVKKPIRKPKKKNPKKKKPQEKKKPTLKVAKPAIAKVNPEDFTKELTSLDGKPELAFKRNFYNFDKIVQGTQLDHDFIVYNLGTAPLIIKEVKSPCDCTTITYPKDPIQPDQQAAIRFQYNSTTKIGKQNPILTVVTNADPRLSKLYVEGEVIAKAEEEKEEISIDKLSAKDSLKTQE